tara:strand:+ start:1416 stop:2903 length:1488 start_codon:yes stop_codon:yes gene_type:complete
MNTLHFKKSLIALLAVAALAGCDSDSDSDAASLPAVTIADQTDLATLMTAVFDNTKLDDDGDGDANGNKETVAAIEYTAEYSTHDSSNIVVQINLDNNDNGTPLTAFNGALTSGAGVHLYGASCVLLHALDTDANATESTVTHNLTSITDKDAVKSEAKALYTLLGCKENNSSKQVNNHSESLLTSSTIKLTYESETADSAETGVVNKLLAPDEARVVTIEQKYDSQKVTLSGFGSKAEYSTTSGAKIALNGVHTLAAISSDVKEAVSSVDTILKLALKVPFFNAGESGGGSTGVYPASLGNLGETDTEKPASITGIFVSADPANQKFVTKEYSASGSGIKEADIVPASHICAIMFQHIDVGSNATIDVSGAGPQNSTANTLGQLRDSAGCKTDYLDFAVSDSSNTMIGFKAVIEFIAADNPGSHGASSYFPANTDQMKITLRRGYTHELVSFENFGADVTTSENTLKTGYATAAGSTIFPIEGNTFRSATHYSQ